MDFRLRLRRRHVDLWENTNGPGTAWTQHSWRRSTPDPVGTSRRRQAHVAATGYDADAVHVYLNSAGSRL
jgi:hypothetical protein